MSDTRATLVKHICESATIPEALRELLAQLSDVPVSTAQPPASPDTVVSALINEANSKPEVIGPASQHSDLTALLRTAPDGNLSHNRVPLIECICKCYRVHAAFASLLVQLSNASTSVRLSTVPTAAAPAIASATSPISGALSSSSSAATAQAIAIALRTFKFEENQLSNSSLPPLSTPFKTFLTQLKAGLFAPGSLAGLVGAMRQEAYATEDDVCKAMTSYSARMDPTQPPIACGACGTMDVPLGGDTPTQRASSVFLATTRGGAARIPSAAPRRRRRAAG